MNNVEDRIKNLWNGYREFYVVGQPIYNMVTEKIKYIELLLRDTNSGSAKAALDKINISRKMSIDLLLAATADLLIEHFKDKKQDINITINISNYVLQKEYILEEFLTRAKDICRNRENIFIEINEFSDLYSMDVERAIEKIKRHGFKVALDDIDSSIIIGKSLKERFKRYLGIKKLSKIIDMIKINSKNSSRTDVEYISKKVLNNKKSIVLEGIETEQELIDLMQNNKSSNIYLQGYFYSQPKKIEELV